MADRFLVLTSCVGRKAFSPGDPAIRRRLGENNLQFPTCDIEREDDYKRALSDFVLPAGEMYKGTFLYVKNFVSELRKIGKSVDFYMISARYGLINENDPVIPYECSLVEMSKNQVRKRAKEQEILKKLRGLTETGDHDEVVMVLGQRYFLTILDHDENVYFTRYLRDARLVVVSSKQIRKSLEGYPHLDFIPVIGIGDRNSKVKKLIEKYRSSTQTLLE